MQLKIINGELVDQIKDLFESRLENPVELLYFISPDDCDTCAEAEQLLDEIASLSSKIHITKYDIIQNLAVAQKFNVQLTPGLVIAGGGKKAPVDYGIRFAGIPSGYEFGSLIQAIVLVSGRDSRLKPGTRRQIKELAKPVHLQVFVTPT